MKKKSLIDRIPWFRTPDADAAPDAESEETPNKEAAQQEEEAEGTGTEEKTITVEQLVEQVQEEVLATVRDEMKAALAPIIEVVQSMDEAIQTQDQALTQLVQEDAAKVKSLLEGESWYKKLYIRSRDEAAAKTEATDAQPQGGERQRRELAAGETPSGVIFGQQD